MPFRTIELVTPTVIISRLAARPDIPNSRLDILVVPNAPTRQRAEERIPQRMFVRLYHPSGGSFEMAQTIDVSRHGARVSTKRPWAPNQHLLLRSLRGNITAYARVVHCEALSEDSYRLGLELYNPLGGWGSSPQSISSPKSRRKMA